MTVVCSACGTVDDEAGRFCRECGAAFATSCPDCAAPVTAGQRFCAECGVRIDGASRRAAEPRPQAEEPVAERRVCSVLFCDLVGFTPLAESRDPEDVREMLSGYFELARTIVDRHGGVIEKFIGDAVMAVWGTPVAVEGDTERAVRAALALVDGVAGIALRGDDGTVLRARAGVATGEVAVTLGALHQGMVAGDVVNTAARLQAVAAPGSVLVDDTTRHVAASAIEFDDAGEFELKGKSAPQHLWTARRVLSGIGGVQRADGLEAPLVGREVELRTVKDWFHTCVERRQPRLVLASGVAGVGKSRLAWEFEKYIDGLSDSLWWHRGRCPAYGDGVAFWALVEIVRQRLNVAEDDPDERVLAQLLAALEQHVADAEQRRYVGVRLGRLLGVAHPEDAGDTLARAELFAGWRVWFESLATAHPVVLVIEDLHRADVGLLDFLDHLIEWARAAPIFVLALGRPELRLDGGGWPAGRNRTVLSLDELDPAAMAQLLDGLVSDLRTGVKDRIAEHAHGVPLYAIETIRGLVDQGVVQVRDGRYRLVGDVGALSVPDTLYGLLAARLDALAAQTRSVVAEVSVLGASFSLESAVAVSGRSEREVTGALAELVRREVLEISADPLSPQRGSYQFVHDMLRQVAYDRQSRRDRKRRHLAVAAHLRETFPNGGEEIADVLAQHYLDALALGPGDADAADVRDEAVHTLIRAAERATRAGAPLHAAEHFARAAELRSEDPRHAAGLLWERAAEASRDYGDFERSMTYAERAIACHDAVGAVRDAARARIPLASALRQSGHLARARAVLADAIPVLSAEPDETTVLALDQLATVEVFDGGPDAGRLSEEALELGQALGVRPSVLASVLCLRGIWHHYGNRRRQAVAYYREAILVGESVGSGIAGSAALNLALVLLPDDPAAAAASAEYAVSACRRVGAVHALGAALSTLTEAYLAVGAWDAAAEVLRTEGGNDPENMLGLHQGIACLSALRGDLPTARDAMGRLSRMLASDIPEEAAYSAVLEAMIAAAAGEREAALDHAMRAVDAIPALGMSGMWATWGWPLAARLAHELGDRDTVQQLLTGAEQYRAGELAPVIAAETLLARARLAAEDGAEHAGPDFVVATSALREKGTPYHLAHGLLDHAAFLARTGNAEQAARCVAEAREIAEQLRAEPLLRRADALRREPAAGAPSR